MQILDELPASARERLDREMARVLKVNVLTAFHRSKPEPMAPLFTWSAPEPSIVIGESALRFLRENAHTLESLANLWWARYLERVNALAPLIIEKVERNGATRSPLARFLRILRQTDEPQCFYCMRPLDAGITHVDHVIPWSFILSDPLWDLVLACSSCNLAKSDYLPHRDYLEKLAAIGLRRAKVTLPPGLASPLVPRADLDRFYDAALSVEWPAGWIPDAKRL